MDVPAKYLTVTVSRFTRQLPAGLEVRLMATAVPDLAAFERDVLVPRFGTGGQTEIASDLPGLDAVTGERLDQGK
ncbi:MAG TPA: hypothetical protein VGH28_04825 [Polyangiaceae bacterium]